MSIRCLCIFLILLLPSLQVSDLNCLRENPGVLDADFTLFNKYENNTSLTAEDVSKLSALFATRFKRAHVSVGLKPGWMKTVINGVSRYMNSTNKDFKLFLTRHFDRDNETTNVTTAIALYQKEYELIINNDPEILSPVVGLYVAPLTETYEEELEALEFVFGSKENSTFPIGYAYFNCRTEFGKANSSALRFLQRLNFISCGVRPVMGSSPEGSADEVIRACDNIRDLATYINVTAEIQCKVRYPSHGTTADGIFGSVSDFHRFWCRILDNVLARNQSQSQIIMQSAFDSPNRNYWRYNTFHHNHDGEYHGGWWRRRHANSYEASAFVEKVEEFEGGSQNGNCTAECNDCSVSQECCHDTKCTLDFSLQPFKKEQRVCKSFATICAPRYELTSDKTVESLPSDFLPDRPTHVTPLPALNESVTSSPPFVSDSDSDSKGSVVNVFSITIFILSTVVFLFAVAAVIFYRRGKASSVLNPQDVRNFFDGTPASLQPNYDNEMAGHLPYDRSLEINKDNFEIYEDELLGCGAFGVVVKGRVGNNDVAIKRMRPGVRNDYFKALLMELKVLMYLGSHDNIVSLHGACTNQLNSGNLLLFLELCPLGNLLQYLRGQRNSFVGPDGSDELTRGCRASALTCRHLLQWSIQIASALQHLAVKKVIHADIAARNILVFSRDQVKLTDFGLSRRLYDYANYSKSNQEPLPWRHMSIEALRDFSFSVQSDVWAFGVTLWEIFSLGEVPYPGQSWSLGFLKLLIDDLRLLRPNYAHPFVYEVMTSCWTKDVQSRPTIALIHSKLTSVLDEIYTSQQYLQLSPLHTQWIKPLHVIYQEKDIRTGFFRQRLIHPVQICSVLILSSSLFQTPSSPE